MLSNFDLLILDSWKVRVSKDGKRYLISPFRHSIPSATSAAPKMPKEIYKEAKDLRQSVVVSTFREGIVQRGTILENPIPAN
ncbi:MAG: hypothetical protein RBS48_13115, partial [Ignavibacteriaceae bacterium]|nr:hypothetical protein [Ignavibacteriaceae bacterium]